MGCTSPYRRGETFARWLWIAVEKTLFHLQMQLTICLSKLTENLSIKAERYLQNSIQALVRLHKRTGGDLESQKKFKELAEGQADMLRRNAFATGGWAYYDHLIGQYDET